MRKCSPMITSRGCVGFCGIEGLLFAVGGEGSTGILKVSEQYKVSKNQWTDMPEMIQERKWPGLCCFERCLYDEDLYCFQGISKKRLKSIEKYDGGTRKWSKFEKDEGTIGNYNLRAIPYQEDILLFGGHKGEGKEVKTMQLMTRNASISQKLCEDTFIPIEQGEQPCFKDRFERVFTVQWDGSKESVWMFEGREWIKVN